MVIVVTLYSGSLVAFLTFPIMEEPVESIDELIAMENAAAHVTWGLLNGRYSSNNSRPGHNITFIMYFSEIEGQLKVSRGKVVVLRRRIAIGSCLFLTDFLSRGSVLC